MGLGGTGLGVNGFLPDGSIPGVGLIGRKRRKRRRTTGIGKLKIENQSSDDDDSSGSR